MRAQMALGSNDLGSLSLGLAGGRTSSRGGGSGGGGIIIYAAAVSSVSSTSITAHGTASSSNPQCYAGAGAGETILISVNDPVFIGSVNVSGGNIGDSGYHSTTTGGLR